MTQIDTSTEAVEALLKDVTPGPWEYNARKQVGPISQEDDQSYGMICDAVCELDYTYHWRSDARFIAAARELVPALLAERDALRAEVERLKAQVDTTWNEAIEAAVKLVNSMANDALTVAAREHAFQIAEAIGELKGESHE